ncbi:hypothetical protein [Flavivirga algicola]|uniref:Uncharacterized protein n=1 Tax=Flavivirga algicola TaxID=2729136 RepID=A0ABX1S0Y7_9FLAO|nr:hypothetical protein [Flavivirga algicola]NMH89016.1 hypothetical protein [Flavivirga algicola]
MLHPTTKGILDGRIIGLNSSVHITSYILKNGIKDPKTPNCYTSNQIKYYVGFGTGYELGQKIKVLLENDTSSKIPLNEKIECFSFLLEKQEICREDLTQSFLDNIEHWEASNIPLSVIENIKTLLKENKIQRSVDTLFLHFKENFNLRPLMEFYRVYDRLKKIRQEKKNNKAYVVADELEKVKVEVQNWISK